jgi:stalled ribosome rescue protein Dom34
MSAYVVWMDSGRAKIFHLKGGEVSVTKAVRHEHDHHTANKNDSKHKDSPKFFQDVVNHLKDFSDRVLLVGPGVSKNHFVNYLETHHLKELAQRIVGTETMDHPTDSQIVAFARKYFPVGAV